MVFKEWQSSSFADGQYIDEVYAKYKATPSQVDPSWIPFFKSLEENSTTNRVLDLPLRESIDFTEQTISPHPSIDHNASADLRVFNLIKAYRTYGHLAAKTNPISTKDKEEPWQLQLSTLGFLKEELSQPFPTCGFLKKSTALLSEIIEALKNTYSGSVGVEYMELQDPRLEAWLQEQIEPNQFKIHLSNDQKLQILKNLNQSELFESFLQTKFTGQKRFSLEGGETLIPILKAIIEQAAHLKLEECVIGMAHRGRLNVLSNVLNKSKDEIFSEFEEGYSPKAGDGSGDVKYHKGFFATIEPIPGHPVKISLTPNPSHLESVNPVVEGQVYAKQLKANDVLKEKVIPILIHGDASLAGQGIVYETLQMYRLPGYSTGGTIHIVINNQIGFTALPSETRSTNYCTDIARAFDAPVFHVNSEDPEGCIYATYLAGEMRHRFHCDVFIDLNCYRKYGHNETDEPSFTQPMEYQLIRKKRPANELYRDFLVAEGILKLEEAERIEIELKNELQKALSDVKKIKEQQDKKDTIKPLKSNSKTSFQPITTAVSKKTIQAVSERIFSIPADFTIHPKLGQLIKDRFDISQGNAEAKPIDWGVAELLAYGTLLWEGIPIRISGQDSCRGTFSHRHAVWVDQSVERSYCPFKHLKEDQGRFDIFNSPVSEFSVLGFEFGYSSAYPESLVIWEAQFGDFSNEAQVIIDQYISTSEQKWQQKVGLTLLLPHGMEGQGPEHSSGRLERFLVLAGHDNMRIVYPSTPAQFFHLLRRQALDPIKKPLIIFTPKGLLRHPACVSPLSALTEGAFQNILDDNTPSPNNIKKLVFVTGHLYYSLIAEREKNERALKEMAIVRIEQLYPLEIDSLKENLAKYNQIKECIWVQEEPKNMGAWEFIHSYLHSLMPENIRLQYIGRERSASPATGSHALHKQQHAAILEELFKEKESRQETGDRKQ